MSLQKVLDDPEVLKVFSDWDWKRFLKMSLEKKYAVLIRAHQMAAQIHLQITKSEDVTFSSLRWNKFWYHVHDTSAALHQGDLLNLVGDK